MDASAKPGMTGTPAPGSPELFIVVLGAPNASDGTLSAMARARAEWAIQEYHARPGAAIILTGGWGPHFNTAPLPHTHYVATHLIAQGIPKSAIRAQLPSANTVEDAALLCEWLGPSNPARLLVITSEHHRARAQLIFQHFFPPRQFHIIATPSCVSESEMQTLLRHEHQRIREIQAQGGVLWNGALLPRLT